MSTADRIVSGDHRPNHGDISQKRFALVVSDWNNTVTDALYASAWETLIDQGAQKENLLTIRVPGSFELSLGAQFMAGKEDIDAVICIGCVIQGETRHFEYICSAVAHGITQVGLKYNKPVIFGVLTSNTYQQALDRAGGKYGNKGEEAAMSAIQMINLL